MKIASRVLLIVSSSLIGVIGLSYIASALYLFFASLGLGITGIVMIISSFLAESVPDVYGATGSSINPLIIVGGIFILAAVIYVFALFSVLGSFVLTTTICILGIVSGVKQKKGLFIANIIFASYIILFMASGNTAIYLVGIAMLVGAILGLINASRQENIRTFKAI